MKEHNKEEHSSPPLHECRVQQPLATMNRVQVLIQGVGILAVLYYRASRLYSPASSPPLSVTLAWVLLFFSELFFSFIWLLGQTYRWRPVSRTVFPERLPGDDKLPAIDVLICTADPEKEPPIEVMNTVISAMALDYPPERLSVYLSDDAGSPITLNAIRQAFSFARFWLPFCRRNGVRCRCPEAYFSNPTDQFYGTNKAEFLEEWEKMKKMYEKFKERVEQGTETYALGDTIPHSKQNHPPLIEVLCENEQDRMDEEQSHMPLLVYVSREKRRGHPHHFKAGALNVLLRISSIMTNGPYILVLDCDMYSNDPTSARQAMCFHLDPTISHSLAFVQFPQKFHNISKDDIYHHQIVHLFAILWKGIDGLQGPILSGSGFYIKREALYGAKPGFPMREELDFTDLHQSRKRFGPSNGLITTISSKFKGFDGIAPNLMPQQLEDLASCAYEKEIDWGKQIGFLYHSLVEDYFTGFQLHCRGWISIFCNPSRPSFLGSVPINLNTTLVQNKRWGSGLLEVCFSRFCPLTFGLSRKSIFQNMCYAALAFQPLNSISLLCYGTIPQLCLLNGMPLFPKVSNPWFGVFIGTYISYLYQYLLEVIRCGGSIKMWWTAQTSWFIKATSSSFSCLDIVMKWVGMKEVNFEVTDKVIDKEQIQRYEMGIFDFKGVTIIIVPSIALAMINMTSFIGGIIRVIIDRSLDEMFTQILLSFFILLISYPIFEGILIRKDTGRVPTTITFLSVIFSIFLLCLGCIIF